MLILFMFLCLTVYTMYNSEGILLRHDMGVLMTRLCVFFIFNILHLPPFSAGDHVVSL